MKTSKPIYKIYRGKSGIIDINGVRIQTSKSRRVKRTIIEVTDGKH